MKGMSFISVILLILVKLVFSQPSGENGFTLSTINNGEELGTDGQAVIGGFDIDNDGWGEFIVFSKQSDAEIKIFEATANNTYELRSSYDITGTVEIVANTRGLAFGNVDNDPESEIVVATGTNTYRVIILDVSTSDLSISAHPSGEAPSPTDNPVGVGILGDSDGDGNPEFVVGNIASSNNIQVYEWNGSGWTIVASTNFHNGVSALQVGNVDNDNEKEIVVLADGGGYGIGIYHFIGGTTNSINVDGTINNNISISSPDNNVVTIGDIDQNGVNEIVAAEMTNDKIYIYENIGGTTYDTDEPGGIYSLGNNPEALAIGDFDNDGKSEIFFSRSNFSGVGVKYIEFTGNASDFSSGNFSSAVTIFDGIGSKDEVNSIAYIGGGHKLLDKDLYRDIAVVTDPVNGNPEVYVLESSVEDNSLPIALTTFDAQSYNDKISLFWITESEIDNAGFEIVRSESRNGQYETIASYVNNPNLQGQGNSTGTHRYEFIDENVSPGHTYWYKLVDVDFNGHKTFHGPISATVPMESNPIYTVSSNLPKNFRLYPNYPNPFNPTTNLKFDIPDLDHGAPVEVSLVIYNSLGEVVKEFYHGKLPAGVYQAVWDGRNAQGVSLPSGIYYAVLRADYFSSTVKMVLLK